MDDVETPDGSFNVDIHIYMVDPDTLKHYYLSSEFRNIKKTLKIRKNH